MEYDDLQATTMLTTTAYRPHQALHNLTPMEYLKLLDQNIAA